MRNLIFKLGLHNLDLSGLQCIITLSLFLLKVPATVSDNCGRWLIKGRAD